MPLAGVLDADGVTANAQDIVIQGSDEEVVTEQDAPVTFARSLTPEQARHSDILLAWAMNGELLPAEHGFPVRMILSGWYGMAAVKWVTRISAIPTRVEGFYQTYTYVLHYPVEEGRPSELLTTSRLRSLIIEPAKGTRMPRGAFQIRGVAWCGSDRLARRGER